MAFYDVADLQPNMVLATDILSKDRRILLRSGVRLNQRHIEALKMLAFEQVEIVTDPSLYKTKPPVIRKKKSPAPELKPEIPKEKIKTVVSTLKVSRPPSSPLTPNPVVVQQADALMENMLEGMSPIKKRSSIGEVIRRKAMAVIEHRENNEQQRRESAKEKGVNEHLQSLIAEHITS